MVNYKNAYEDERRRSNQRSGLSKIGMQAMASEGQLMTRPDLANGYGLQNSNSGANLNSANFGVESMKQREAYMQMKSSAAGGRLRRDVDMDAN